MILCKINILFYDIHGTEVPGLELAMPLKIRPKTSSQDGERKGGYLSSRTHITSGIFTTLVCQNLHDPGRNTCWYIFLFITICIVFRWLPSTKKVPRKLRE